MEDAGRAKIDDSTVASRLPQEIVALVVSLVGPKDDSVFTDVGEKELVAMMPSKEVVNAILASQGLRQASPIQDLDQAMAWINEQTRIQNRAMEVEQQLQELEPYGKNEALKSEIPGWMTESWATKLLYKWSDGLSDAIADAEVYLMGRIRNGGNNART